MTITAGMTAARRTCTPTLSIIWLASRCSSDQPPSNGLHPGQAADYTSAKTVRQVRRRFATVFQQYNLFQNMIVLGNVTIAHSNIKKRPRAWVEDDARRLLAKVSLADRLDAYPDQLSNG